MLAETLSQKLESGDTVALVEIIETAGSSPRDIGARMLVDLAGFRGTIGGGVLEFRAIAEARKLLTEGRKETILDLPLGPELGQCCGGRVKISVRRAGFADVDGLQSEEDAAHQSRPAVLVFGAGHVGAALARALAPLPITLTIIDERAEWLAPLRAIGKTIETPLPEAAVTAAPPGAAYVILTHDHAQDFLIAEAALSRADASYVGMIGSTTKRAQLTRQLARRKISASALICPIGTDGPNDKRPEVIALAVAAEIAAAIL